MKDSFERVFLALASVLFASIAVLALGSRFPFPRDLIEIAMILITVTAAWLFFVPSARPRFLWAILAVVGTASLWWYYGGGVR